MKAILHLAALLVLCAALAFPCAAGAVPANAGPIEAEEPATGLRVSVFQAGDEFFSYCTDEQGALLELDAEGYFRRVVRDGSGYALGGYVTQDGADLYAAQGESVLRGDAGLREKLTALRGSLRAAVPMLLSEEDEGDEDEDISEEELIDKPWLYEHLIVSNDAAAGHWVEYDEYVTADQYAPRGKTAPLLVLKLNYEDVKCVFSDKQWHDRIFEGGVPAYYTEVSGGRFTYVPAKEKSGAVNDGVVSVTLPFRCPRYERADYGAGGVETVVYKEGGKLYGVNNVSMLFAYALPLADEAVDFKAYDTNGDGRVDPTELAVTVIQPGLEASWNSYRANGHAGVWAHSSYINESYGYRKLMIRLDGVCLYKYTIMGENVNDYYYYAGDEPSSEDEDEEGADEGGGVTAAAVRRDAGGGDPAEPEQPQQPLQAQFGTLCHELGHDLGLMDLYDLSYTDINAGGGELSLMSGGARGARKDGEEGSCPTHLDPYSKIRLGFYEATETTADGSVVLYAAGDDPSRYNILKIPSGEEGVYFLVENRQLAGFDEGLFNPYGILMEPLRGGLAVWRIDENVIEKYWQENRVNSNPGEHGVVLLWTREDPYAIYQDENMVTPFYRDGMQPLYLEMDTDLAVQAKGHGMAMSAVVTGLAPAPQPPDDLPQTGDGSQLTAWLLLAASAAGLATLLASGKRKAHRKA